MTIGLKLILSNEAILKLNDLRLEFGTKRLFFNTWLQDAYSDLGKTRELYKIVSGENEVGLLLLHFLEQHSIKINALLIYLRFRNKGFGTEALQQATQFVFPEINWFFTQCRENDFIAINVFKKVGFVQVAKLKHLEEDAYNIVFVFNTNQNFSADTAKKLIVNFYSRSNQKILFEFQPND